MMSRCDSPSSVHVVQHRPPVHTIAPCRASWRVDRCSATSCSLAVVLALGLGSGCSDDVDVIAPAQLAEACGQPGALRILEFEADVEPQGVRIEQHGIRLLVGVGRDDEAPGEIGSRFVWDHWSVGLCGESPFLAVEDASNYTSFEHRLEPTTILACSRADETLVLVDLTGVHTPRPIGPANECEFLVDGDNAVLAISGEGLAGDLVRTVIPDDPWSGSIQGTVIAQNILPAPIHAGRLGLRAVLTVRDEGFWAINADNELIFVDRNTNAVEVVAAQTARHYVSPDARYALVASVPDAPGGPEPIYTAVRLLDLASGDEFDLGASIDVSRSLHEGALWTMSEFGVVTLAEFGKLDVRYYSLADGIQTIPFGQELLTLGKPVRVLDDARILFEVGEYGVNALATYNTQSGTIKALWSGGAYSFRRDETFALAGLGSPGSVIRIDFDGGTEKLADSMGRFGLGPYQMLLGDDASFNEDQGRLMVAWPGSSEQQLLAVGVMRGAWSMLDWTVDDQGQPREGPLDSVTVTYVSNSGWPERRGVWRVDLAIPQDVSSQGPP